MSSVTMRLFTHRSCWVPTRRGWLVLAAIFVASVGLVVLEGERFLAISRPISAEVLIVEGWLPDYAMRGAVEEFKRGQYKLVITTGRDFSERWFQSRYNPARFGSEAEFAAANLEAMGLPKSVAVAVPPGKVRKDRTYQSALAVKAWLGTNAPALHSANLYSYGPHARRSWLLYRKAFGRFLTVGVIAHPPQDYNSKWWWTSMDGATDVIGEGIAYFYAKFLFYPSTPRAGN